MSRIAWGYLLCETAGWEVRVCAPFKTTPICTRVSFATDMYFSRFHCEINILGFGAAWSEKYDPAADMNDD